MAWGFTRRLVCCNPVATKKKTGEGLCRPSPEK